MAGRKAQTNQRRAAYTALTGSFLTIFSGMALATRKRKHKTPTPMEFLQLGLATYRLGRLISYDKVFEPYRAPFTKTVPDASGEGDTVEPKGRGVQAAIGDLICCPICSGTWVAAALVYGLNLFPNVTRLFISIMSAVGAAELLNAATEALQWNGQLAREQAGAERSNRNGEGEEMHDRRVVARISQYPGQEVPRRRFDDREWKRNPTPPVSSNREANG